MTIIALRPEIHLVSSLWKKKAQQQISREEPKKRNTRKAHPETSPRAGGRFNSVWLGDFPNLAATDTFFFCIIVTLPRELLASTSNLREHRDPSVPYPSHAVQSAFNSFEVDTSQLCFIPPVLPLEEAASSHFPLTLSCHSLFSGQSLHLLSLELKPTRSRSFIPFMRPP